MPVIYMQHVQCFIMCPSLLHLFPLKKENILVLYFILFAKFSLVSYFIYFETLPFMISQSCVLSNFIFISEMIFAFIFSSFLSSAIAFLYFISRKLFQALIISLSCSLCTWTCWSVFFHNNFLKRFDCNNSL